MNPQLMMLGERMAQHYVATIYKIRLIKKRAGQTQLGPRRTWEAMKREEKQEMIEAFASIIGKAGDMEQEQLLNPASKLIR